MQEAHDTSHQKEQKQKRGGKLKLLNISKEVTEGKLNTWLYGKVFLAISFQITITTVEIWLLIWRHVLNDLCDKN